MATKIGFKIPSWVPQLILDETQSVLNQAADEKAREVLKRLLTHSRMRSVWRELTKQRRDLSTYKPTGHFYSQETPPVRFLGMSLQVNTLVGFFNAAYGFAVVPAVTVTRNEVIDRRLRSDNTAMLLEKTARGLRAWHNNPEVGGQFNMHMWACKSEPFPVPDNLRLAHAWTDLNQVADELNKLAQFFYFMTSEVNPGGVVVQRRKGREDVRAYVLNLAGLCRSYFGSSLYSVIATTASVALKAKVTPAFVKRCVQRH